MLFRALVRGSHGPIRRAAAQPHRPKKYHELRIAEVMEPSQQPQMRRLQTPTMQQRPNLRLDAMLEKKPMIQVPQTFSASTSRAMNSKVARNRTTSESAVIHGKHAASTPLVFDREITIAGNKLVHLPPQTQPQAKMERRESGTLMGQPQRNSTGVPFGNPAAHGIGAPPTSAAGNIPSSRKMQHPFQNQRQSPSMEGPDLHRFGDSPRSGSFNQSELSGSYSCADNLTQLSNARPIPGTQSSGSGHSGSPITIGGATLGSNFRQIVSSSAPTSSIDMDAMLMQSSQEGGTASTGDEYYRDRRKKDIHNMIERRRRYNINDRIKELGLMLPKSSAEDMKLNKGTILKASCDYIRQLQRDRELMLKQQAHQQKLENAAKQYAERIRELEECMARQGVQPPPAHLPPLPRFTSLDRPIKQEMDDTASPNHTPCGSLSSSGFMSQLSDTTAAMQIASPLGRQPMQAATSHSESYFSVGSSSPPEYGTPQNWRDHSMQQPFPDLMMDDIATLQGGNPLLTGDPLISQAGAHPSPHLTGGSQMSPDIQWDQSGFSPEGHNGLHQQHMDFS
ncbi:hypothetical protein RB195_000313 [Necator americanus]|uniref:BHLH domain-containing protein n=1 Tax=Necator americanus TaxID=51031 RepID=A0ABR1D915_NECAM